MEVYETLLLLCESMDVRGSMVVQEAVKEFLRFMTIQATEQPSPSVHSIFSPSLQLDKIWRSVILDTRTYKKLCANIVEGGREISYSAVPNPISRDVRIMNTTDAYDRRFHYGQPNWIWDDTFQFSKLEYNGPNTQVIQIFIYDLSDRLATHVVQLDWTLGHLIYIFMLRGFGWRNVRFIFNGKEIHHGKTLQEFGVEANSTLNMTGRLLSGRKTPEWKWV